jgi:flagellar M-ring protein FliF
MSNPYMRDALVDEMEQETRLRPGGRRPPAVGLPVSSAYAEPGPVEAKPTPLTPVELEGINNLVKEAMGYNQERGDTVNVVNAAFSDVKTEDADPLWKDPENIKLAKELLKSLLIFGLAFYLVFGVLRPLLRDLVRPMETAVTPEGGAFGLDEEEEKPEEEMTEEEKAEVDSYQELLRVVKEFARDNPQITADVLKEWMAKE